MKFKKIKSKVEISKTEKEPEVYLIDAPEKEARGIVASLKDKKFSGKIAVLGRDDNFNRRALETLKIDYLVSPERELRFGDRKDTLKQRDSGLNHVLGKIAKEKGITIVIDYDDWNSIADRKKKALRLARIIQNVKVCRKAKCKIEIWSGKIDKKEIESFGYSIGMSSQQVREAV